MMQQELAELFELPALWQSSVHHPWAELSAAEFRERSEFVVQNLRNQDYLFSWLAVGVA